MPSASQKEVAMKRFCLGICVVLLLFFTCASSQASQSESKQSTATASNGSATLLRMIARAHTRTTELQHTSIVNSPVISETIVTYEFTIRSGAQEYISRYTPEKQPGNMPDAWWRGKAPVQMRIRKSTLFIKLPEGGEVASHIVRRTSTAN